jgi:hypothetical protein
MSDLQHRLYHYEVNPPATAWDKIAIALDDSHLSDTFRSKIYDAQVTPPAGAWQAIATGLDELEITPQYPSTLYNMEVAPPAIAWDKIKESLDEEQKPEAPVRRLVPFFRYAAAAAVIAAIAFGAFRILSGNSQVDGIAQEQNDTTTSNTGAPSASTPTYNADAVSSDEERNNAALEESKGTYASLDASDRQRMTRASEEYFEAPASPMIVTAAFAPETTYRDLACNEVSTPAFADGSIDMASRYVLLLTPDGQVIRVSKKLGELACCVSGAEQDAQCKDQLKKWRQKLADSPVANSPIDILTLLQTLDN